MKHTRPQKLGLPRGRATLPNCYARPQRTTETRVHHANQYLYNTITGNNLGNVSYENKDISA
jgi:hypothetical protein